MPLEFDMLPPYNRCGAAIIAMLSLAERLARATLGLPSDSRTFDSWREVLNHAKSQATTGKFKSDGKERWPSDFLEIGRQNIGLTNRNLETSLPRLESAVRAVVDAYLASSAPLAAFRDEGFTAPFLRDAAKAFSALQAEGAFAELVTAIAPAKFPNEITQEIVARLFENIPVPSHPNFPSITLFDPHLVKSEFLGTGVEAGARSSSDRGSFHLYAVLREARGWSVQNAADRNIIVRDLLWIRNPLGTYFYDQSDYNEEKGFIGMYVSAIDRNCFYIERLDVNGPEITFSAREDGGGEHAQRLTMMFPTTFYSHPLQIRLGVLTGSAGQARDLYAWKCALIRPEWTFTDQLSTIMYQTTPTTIKGLFRICADLDAACVIFSDELRTDLNDNIRPEIQERREIFRRFIDANSTAKSPPPLGRPTTEKLQDKFLDYYSENMSGNQFSNHWWNPIEPSMQLSKHIVIFLNKFIAEERYLIEPAQIVNSDRSTPTQSLSQMPDHLVSAARMLLDIDNVVQYGQTSTSHEI